MTVSICEIKGKREREKEWGFSAQMTVGLLTEKDNLNTLGTELLGWAGGRANAKNSALHVMRVSRDKQTYI